LPFYVFSYFSYCHFIRTTQVLRTENCTLLCTAQRTTRRCIERSSENFLPSAESCSFLLPCLFPPGTQVKGCSTVVDSTRPLRNRRSFRTGAPGIPRLLFHTRVIEPKRQGAFTIPNARAHGPHRNLTLQVPLASLKSFLPNYSLEPKFSSGVI